MAKNYSDSERKRLAEGKPWRRWGPYLSERQWGTVREDYSADGNAWEYFPYEDARSRVYRWGEDGIGGLCDERQRLCLGVALWNGRDATLKERLFGLTNSQGNHGEDVKESYYYLDATPTHSYLHMLYKYPQSAFPYDRLLEENQRRDRAQREYELLDTQAFEQDRYFDVHVEYAKAGPEDIVWRISARNRGDEDAEIHLLPQVWFRNIWSWHEDTSKPSLELEGSSSILARHSELGCYRLCFEGSPDAYFCDNETNVRRVFGAAEGSGYYKDAIHERVVCDRHEAVNPDMRGTKAAAHYRQVVAAGGSMVVRARLHPSAEKRDLEDVDEIFAQRKRESDEFYEVLQKEIQSEDERRVQRQALAGLIWSKQFYRLNMSRWLEGDPTQPPPPTQRLHGRNSRWEHIDSNDVLLVPDKWEFPWYAAWDLAFHCIPLALIDAELAKEQLVLLTREWYMHPNGQLPAYEWAFGDANPPVHAWAAWRVFQIDRKQRGGSGDLQFLERVFHKLLLNFTWWVNREDAQDDNVFQGGFLGLDNIGVFDRNAPLPAGGQIEQSDATAWMAMYSLNLMRIALELALHDRAYEDIATKFFEHFLYIAQAMDRVGGRGGLWDEEDGFFYDWLALPGDDGGTKKIPMRARSIVGLIPLFAVEVLDEALLDELPAFKGRLEWFLEHRPDLAALVSHWDVPGSGRRRLLSMLRGHRMKCLLKRMLDESEFLSDHGVRSLSRIHLDHPFRFQAGGCTHEVRYSPAESDSGLFGGNSNWRGPVWMPLNYMIVESLQRFHYYYGDDFKVECPTGSGNQLSILEVAQDLTRRLVGIFLRRQDGTRPVFGDYDKLQSDPHFRDHLLFFECFDGDVGRGVGASHQTGWTALVAKLIQASQ
ncbi:MAG: glucosidase [Myxococcales bacterium]|jgi:hypothetical protein